MKKSYAVGLLSGLGWLWLVCLSLNKVGAVGPQATASERVKAPTISSHVVQARGKSSLANLFSVRNGSFAGSNFSGSSLALEGELDAGYAPELLQPGNIYAIALQTDGKVIIGGESFKINGVRNNGLARLNADGSTDTSFNARPIPDTNIFDIFAIAVQPDGKILVGGTFNNVNGTARTNIARLHADGSVDTTFLNNLAGPNGNVNSIALQPDGKTLIGGTFSSVNGTTRNNIARLNPDGTLDTSFANGLTGTNVGVKAIALQPDGKVVIGGSFTSVNGTARNRIARLHSDGALDTTFLNGMSGLSAVCAAFVQTIALQPDGKLLIGGSFDSVNGTARNSIARLNADGSLDATFANITADVGCGDVYDAIVLQADGKAIIGGRFGSINGTTRKRIARINTDGTLDAAFLNGQAGVFGSFVRALALQPDGDVMAGGTFSRVNGVEHHSTARLNSDGTLDNSFSSGHVDKISVVSDLALQADGKSVIAGFFTSFNGVLRHNLARLNSDGTLDAGFSSETAETDGVRKVELQTDGKILIGGSFSVINGVTRNNLARLNNDGTLDTGFLNGLAGANGTVNDITLQPDGRILIGGDFTSVNGATRNRIAQLNSNGTLDTSFANFGGANFAVNAVALQTDGKAVIGGGFTTINGTARNRIARLNADGSLDTAFLNGQAGASSQVLSLALQLDGKILVGGLFAKMNGVTRPNIARLNSDGSLDAGFVDPGFQTTFIGELSLSPVNAIVLQPDGKILIGGSFLFIRADDESGNSGYIRNGAARLHANGMLDATCLFGTPDFPLFGANGTVNAIALQTDGKVLFGGDFHEFNGVERFSMARLQQTICINNVSVSEGNSGTTNANFTVSLSGFLTQTATVNFATANGTATAGSDYTANSGSLTFNPGDTSKPITVSLNGDIAVEPDETFFVNLSNPTNITLARDQGTGTILNDDTPCTLTCPPNQTVDIGSNAPQCGALVNYSAPTTSGSCGTVICTPQAGSLFPVGTTTVTCTAANNGSCSFTVTVINSFALSQTRECFTPAASSGSLSVSASQGCNWMAVSNDSFITITAGSSGSGNGTVNYSVAANTASTRRTGTMTIAGQTFTVQQGVQFNDVPTGHQFYTEISKLSARGITLGCGNGSYCPNDFVTREQMAAFIIRALGDFNPPPPALQRFADVPPANPFYAFIEQMALRQITLGCGSGNYCPAQNVTREQMAAFIIRARHAPGYVPPAPAQQQFADVPPTNPFYAHIEEMAVRGITLGCGGGNYCPSDFVTRGQMAAFLIRAFGC